MKLRQGLAAAALALLTACGSQSSPGAASAPQAADTTAQYTDNATATQRHAQTVAYAQQILHQRPVLAGETSYNGTIPKNLRQPNEVPGATNRIVRRLYVAIDRSPERIFQQLKKATVAKSQLGGYGGVGAGDNGPRFASVRFDRVTLPPAMVDGELLIEVQGRAGKPTLLAEFAQVVPHPAWPASERIPTGPATATVTRITYSPAPHRITARHVVRLDSATAQQLVDAFNDSWIAPPWVCTGGPVVLGPTTTYRVRIHADGHEWRVDLPGYCSAAPVTRDGHNAPAINAGQQFVRLAHQR